MKKLVTFIVLALLLTFWATPVYAAAAPPALPHAFYGSVTINGVTTPDGSQISATVDSGEIVATQNPVATVRNTYGIDSPKLLVQGNGLSGTITFYVNGVQAQETTTFQAGGGPTRQDLTVLATAPSLVTSAATSVTTSRATLRGNLANFGTALSADVSFEWGRTTAYGNETTAQAMTSTGSFNFSLTGLSDGTTYHFRAVAVGHGTDYGADRTFTTRAEPAPAVAPPAPPLGTTDVRGMVTTAGVFSEPVTATSEDELCTLDIPEGTVGLTEELEPLDEITVVIMDEPPDPPEDAHVVGLTYDLGPDGATFDPPITLTFSYDPGDLPEGVAEEDLVLAYYDEESGEWVELDCVVDTVNNTITASVPHFTTFAVIGRVPAPPEEEEVPTVVPPVGEEEEEEEPEVVVIPLAPAAFSVSYLSVSPRLEVESGETVTISVLVANTGGESGSYTVVLNIDGAKEAEERVTVAAGESQEVSFSVTREEADSYAVAVDGLSGSFTVVAPPEGEEEEEEVPTKPGINWPLYGGIIAAAVIVAGLLIYFFVFRRREY